MVFKFHINIVQGKAENVSMLLNASERGLVVVFTPDLVW